MKRSGLFFGVAAFTALACGGIDESNLFSSSGTTTSSSDDSGTSTNADSGHVTTPDAGTSGDDSGIIVIDSGTPPPTDPGIFCGTDGVNTTYCNGGDICCVSGEQSGATPTYACSSESSCTGAITVGDPNLVVPCDDTQECGGTKKCCGTFVTGNGTTTPSYYSQVRCAVTCNATDDRIFCNPANGNAECNGTDVCEASGALPGFTVCGPP